MDLKLERPLIFFDIESTGLNITKDRIIELSYVKVFPDGHDERKTYRVNPGIPIPAESTEVHHITDADVAGEPRFEQLAPEIWAKFKDCDLAGFNSNYFDVPMLVEELARANYELDLSQVKLIDVQNIYHKMEKRDLEAACLFYCGHEMENHHSSASDAATTYDVLRGQLDRYQGKLENNVAALAEFSRMKKNVDLAGRIILDETGTEVFNFGKHKGKSVAAVLKAEPGCYIWMMNGDFSVDTKQALTRILLKAKPDYFGWMMKSDKLTDAAKQVITDILKREKNGNR